MLIFMLSHLSIIPNLVIRFKILIDSIEYKLILYHLHILLLCIIINNTRKIECPVNEEAIQ